MLLTLLDGAFWIYTITIFELYNLIPKAPNKKIGELIKIQLSEAVVFICFAKEAVVKLTEIFQENTSKGVQYSKLKAVYFPE